jgi:hypothetical protein
MDTPDRLYVPVAVAPHPEPVDQVRDSQQATGSKRAPARRHHHERVRRRHIGPSRWQREQLPVLVVQVDRSSPQFCRCATNSKSRPDSGWNG